MNNSQKMPERLTPERLTPERLTPEERMIKSAQIQAEIDLHVEKIVKLQIELIKNGGADD